MTMRYTNLLFTYLLYLRYSEVQVVGERRRPEHS